MRIALITEGVGEFRGLPSLYSQLSERSGNVFLNPLKVNVSPDAAPRIVARECRSRVLIARAKRADLVVVLLDREGQERCAGLIATEIESVAQGLCGGVSIRVVIKDRTFENWLISDLDALRQQPQRYDVSNATVRAVEPNKADRCNAKAILDRCTRGDGYDKVRDGQKICALLNVGQAASHSRSFRHLLHVIGDAAYVSQCRVPD